jgi:hypothetical protein
MREEKEKPKVIFVSPQLEKAVAERAKRNHRPWLREVQAILEQVVAEENKERK